MTVPLVVGVMVWIPALFLVLMVRGRWFAEGEALPAATAILAFLVPGVANSRAGGAGIALAAWSIALAPLFALLAAVAQLYLTAVMSNNRPSKFHERLSSVLVAACFIAIGLLNHCLLR